MISDWYEQFRNNLAQNDILQDVIDAMQNKFMKYWKKIPPVTVIANCLDPRFKAEVTIDMLKVYKENMNIPQEGEKEYVNKTLEEMHDIYASRHAASTNPPIPISRPHTSASGLLKALSRKKKTAATTNISSSNHEISIYNLTGCPDKENPNFDILAYWRKHAIMFLVLSSMARDIFAIPMSTVPSESCFSACNRVLTDSRNRLGNKTFEALVCLKDWFDAEVRTQDSSSYYESGPEYATSGAEAPTSAASGSEEQNESDDGWDAPETDDNCWWTRNDY